MAIKNWKRVSRLGSGGNPVIFWSTFKEGKFGPLYANINLSHYGKDVWELSIGKFSGASPDKRTFSSSESAIAYARKYMRLH